MKKTKILLTGGYGFIGKNIVEQLMIYFKNKLKD